MGIQSVAIKVALQGAASTRREADSTGKSIRGIGTSAEHTAKKTRLAELSMRGFEKTTHRTHEAIRGILGATGLAGLALGTGEIVKSAIDAQTAQAKLRATMKSSGLAWRRYGKDVTETLEQQSLKTGFSIGDVTDSFSNFIRTTGSVRKATQLNNMAFDVARTRHLSLASAQSLLARVYNGSYMGLKRLGIGITAITAHQDALRASGQKYTHAQMARAKADDMAATKVAALSAVQVKFGGQSKAYTKTAQGSVDLLKTSLEAIQVRIGTVLLPYVAKGAQKLADLAQQLVKKWPEIKRKITDAADKVKARLQPLISYIVNHKKGVAEFAGALVGVGLALKTIHKVGNLTGIGKLASIASKTPISRVVGFATRADGTIKHPFYVVVLDKAPSVGIGKKALSVAEKVGPAAAALAPYAAVAAAASIPIAAAFYDRKQKATYTASHRAIRDPSGGVAFNPAALYTRSMATGVYHAAVRQASGVSPAGRSVTDGTQQLVGGFPHTIVVPVHINGREVARAVTHAANKQKALK